MLRSSILSGRRRWTAFSRNFSTEKIEISDLNKQTVDLYRDLLKGDRAALARSITLVESTHAAKREEARKLVSLTTRHLRDTGLDKSTFRVGLSGPPGAGKSTFIDAMGTKLTEKGQRVAVLAVDPSSSTQGGSLLGDKTRMPNLTRDKNAFIRPSPNQGHLGGVTRNTNEAIILCEACGYNIILVETVGVGQSEFAVADMVDAFCLLLPPASGDELQGIKRGIVEMTDLVLINKSDGDLLPSARRTASSYMSALKLMRSRNPYWKTKTKLISSKTGDGLDEAWEKLEEFKAIMLEKEEFQKKRQFQRKKWMWNYINDRLMELFKSHPTVVESRLKLEKSVADWELSPGTASDILIAHFLSKTRS